MTKHEETEVLKVYETWLYSYLNGDVKTYDSYFDDSFHFIGSTNNEEFLNRKETTNFFNATAEQLSGKSELRNETRIIEQFGELVFITHLFDAWFMNGKDWSFYNRFRFTNALRKNKDGWRFIYQHYSTPDSKAQEGQTIGFDKITAENLELREAIQRRTKELEEKNRELEIEGALQRIRAQAVAMKESSDLLDIVVAMRTEFTKLGHEAHYFWHMMWLEKTYEKAMTSGDGTKIGFVMELPRHMHGNIPLLAKWEKSKKPIVVYAMDAQEAIAYVDKMVDLGDFKNIDPQAPSHDDIRHIGGLTFIMARTTHGEIGYSLPGVVKNPPAADLEILKRFAEAFDFAHRRFLDLKKAENQAREVRVELALEKVRSRTMAMQHSDELPEAANLLFTEVQKLGVPAWSCGYNILSDDKKSSICIMSSEGELQIPFVLPLTEHKSLKPWYKAIINNKKFFFYGQDGKDLVENYNYMKSLPDLKATFKQLEDAGLQLPTQQFNHLVRFNEGFLLFITYEKVPEVHDIFQRFGKVFEQTYTRFLDLQKAEAQAREAQIETALERVRSRTMAMQKSEELEEVIFEVLKKLQGLGISMEQRAAAIFTYEAGNKDYTQWVASPEYNSILSFNTPYFNHPVQNDIWNARQNRTDFYAKPYPFEVKNSLFKYLFDLPALKNMPQAEKTKALNFKHYSISIAFQKYASLVVVDHSGVPLTEAENSIIVRLNYVFHQTYTRFLDLQKAEAQARESQIEAALERIRAQTMAMHSSNELESIIQVVYDQFVRLGITLDHSGFIMNYKTNEDMIIWLADEHSVTPQIRLPYFDSPHWNSFMEAKENGVKLFVNHLDFKEKNKFYNQVFNYIPELPEEAKNHYRKVPSLTIATALVDDIGLYVENFSGTQYNAQDQRIILRFAEVFQQSYTRFRDLQKAEAQAKEAQIEAALERVRSRTMGMQKSDELFEVGEVVYKELSQLGIQNLTTGYVLFDEKARIGYSHGVNPANGSIRHIATGMPHTETAVMKSIVKSWKKREPILIIELNEEETKKHQTFIAERSTNFPLTANELIAISPKRLKIHTLNFKQGYLLILGGTLLTDEQQVVGVRFAKVFEQVYTRFQDLQKAEGQAREAQIEAALERVRSKTMAMHSSEDVDITVLTLFEELLKLGLDKSIRCGIGILQDREYMETWSATSAQNGEVDLKVGLLDMTLHPLLVQIKKIWKNGKKTLSYELEGKEVKEYYTILNGAPKYPFQVDLTKLPNKTYHNSFYFSAGVLFAFTDRPITKEAANVLNRFSGVFEQTYTRFLDLQKAEAQTLLAEQNLIKLKAQKQRAEDALSELQQTQKQLIQSEKMASLGELTAGIAHEIQNPLNFVNNFSEVSKELLEEMQEEIEKGDFEEVKAIMENIIQNLEKINHHGKRADGIVKGMLQHSRSSSGIKEPTDINALADEYLRLAYHGLRAKEKSFNAELVTDFDDTIGKINVIPQDMGRVILNLITNAFYAVNEKKQQNEDFNPIVSVSTKKTGDHLEIKITDNGNGIPKEVVDKIFQPFFTTKPTGQGTGLGLSMSYDIVTKGHGGELAVETEEGKGSEFLITLPALA